MKRILCILLAMMMLFALSACGGESAPKKEDKPAEEIEVTTPESDYEQGTPPEAAEPSEEEKPEDAEPEVKPEEKPEAKPEAKPEPETKPETTPEVKPEIKPEPAPEAKPEEKPEASANLGDSLAAVFRANASKSGLEIADAIIGSGKFPAELPLMSMEIEEGYLSGFDNVEIKGFSNGAMFAPAMGTIPVVGYVFTLADGTDADAFVKTLKESANLRWNVCTAAEQMVVEKSGNKVFFVMCPTNMDE